MLTHILVPTDFGEPAEHALELAIALAKKFDSKLTLLHTYMVPSLPYTSGLILPLEEIAAAAQEALDTALARARERYPRCEGLVHAGAPHERIIAVAKEAGVDLIAMGTHGRRGVARFMLGSVAERVVRLSPVPVLTVTAPGAQSSERSGT
jgi:nucleotide-binding universal stress UspA family protein